MRGLVVSVRASHFDESDAHGSIHQFQVFETSHAGGYDCILGTSDKGAAVENMDSTGAVQAKSV